MCPNGTQIFPTSERQVRDLVELEPEQQRTCWNLAVEKAGGKVPSGRIVKETVQELVGKATAVPAPIKISALDFCQSGQVFRLTKLVEPEKKYNGYPCIVLEPRDYTVKVDVADCTLTVRPENMERIDDPQAERTLPEIVGRIRRLREFDLDSTGRLILNELGKHTYLTEFEDKVLRLLEEDCGLR